MIFDYFKEAYHLIRSNKKLYRPQIVYIIIKTLMILALGVSIFVWLMNPNISVLDTSTIFGPLIAISIASLLALLVCGILSVIIESGLYNMYKSCVQSGQIEDGDFSLGVKKYFFKFLFGKIVIFLAWIVILPVYLITGIVSLSIGLFVIPMLVSIFLTMWKVSLVFNEFGIFKAMKDSFKFAKTNFIPLSFLQLIHWAFTKGASSGSSYNFNTSGFRDMGNKMPKDLAQNLYDPEITNVVLKVLRISTGILVPIITIAALLGALIRMVFEIFFSLVLFITFQRKFLKPEVIADTDLLPSADEQPEGEVLI